MNNKFKITCFVLLMSFIYPDIYTGYLKSIEMSFCMDECSHYYLEAEEGNFITNISDLNNVYNLEDYINRFVTISGVEISCVECSALNVETIYISDDCNYPVPCFVDPCEVAPECEINIPVECVPNYCGGCYADYYDLEGNLVDCSSSVIDECYDVSGLFFGMCDMYMGVAVIDETCEGVSGCGWILDDVDYSDAFFNSFDECENACMDALYTCVDIEFDYDQLHTGVYSECDVHNDCVAVWRHCDVGLGGCHYAVNAEEYPFYQINALVNDWSTYDCGGGVCDCMSLPNSVCNDGDCELAYCYDENPAGCFVSGCPDGFECIDDPNQCVPSMCYCDESNFYGNWYCTEDCGGGTCVNQLNGDVNYDGNLDVSDIVIIVNMVLQVIEVDMIADMNDDNSLDIIDIVQIVSLILNN